MMFSNGVMEGILSFHTLSGFQTHVLIFLVLTLDSKLWESNECGSSNIKVRYEMIKYIPFVSVALDKIIHPHTCIVQHIVQK